MAEPSGRLIEWTGERCVPWSDEVQGIYEHLHRYHFAASLAEGKHVLDLASGEGYGSAILARRAKSVVGLELDPTSVAHSRSAYARPDLEFVEGSMLELGAYADGSFDLVVCFEAIEHVREQDELLAGIARVLNPGGVAVLSTPERDEYNAVIHETNPFHVRELARAEFVDLLRARFEHVALWGQTGVAGSRLARLDDAAETLDTAEIVAVRRDGEWLDDERVPPTYLIATASRAPLPSTPARSYLVDPTREAQRVRDMQARERERKIAELKAENASLWRENERFRQGGMRRPLRRLFRKLRAGLRDVRA